MSQVIQAILHWVSHGVALPGLALVPGGRHPRSFRLLLSALFLLLPLAGVSRADTLDEIKKRGVIIWGGDQEGGGPYIYPSPENPKRLTGFEVELMDMLAAKLGVHAQFKQADWYRLPNLLNAADIDIIANGYELTQPRLDSMLATIPYFIYELQLLARKNDQSIRSWEDLDNLQGKKKVVGVLGGSAANTYVDHRLDNKVTVRRYDSTTKAMEEVENGTLAATVQDLPAAIFYQNRYEKLHFVDAPVAPGYYVIYLRLGDQRLCDALNKALSDVMRDGQLRSLYERYGLWNQTQEKLGTPGLGAIERSTEAHGWAVVAKNLRVLLEAAGMTVLLSCASMPLAIVLGLLVALGRLYGPAPIRWPLSVYVEILRGTPLLFQLFTIYYVIRPHVWPNLDPVVAAILGLAVNYSAYEAEIYRAGLLAIPAGQMEAALSLGFSRLTALRRIVVPQAVRLVVPPVTNDFIALFKDTSICSTITVYELSKQCDILVGNTNAYFELAAVTACLYLLMSYPLSLLARRLEKRMPHLVY